MKAPDRKTNRLMRETASCPRLFPCHTTRNQPPATRFPLRQTDDESKGRKILCAFTCLQRIGKTPSTEFWIPPETQENIAAALRGKREHDTWAAPLLLPAAIEWAAVRQFDLLQEAGNLSVYDLEVDAFQRAHTYLMNMRAGGYRLSMITLGAYSPDARVDEQTALDDRLSQEIAQMIHMLYLAQPSGMLTDQYQEALSQQTWRLEESLPHVAMAFGERALFERRPSAKTLLSAQFVDVLTQLQQKNIGHDVAVGLTLPDHHKSHQQAYICKREEQFHLFHMTLTSVFSAANWLSLSGLQHDIATGRDEMAVMRHMRGYGDHTSGLTYAQNRRLATCLPAPRLWAA